MLLETEKKKVVVLQQQEVIKPINFEFTQRPRPPFVWLSVSLRLFSLVYSDVSNLLEDTPLRQAGFRSRVLSCFAPKA